MIESATSGTADAQAEADRLSEESAEQMLKYEEEKAKENTLLESYNKKL